MKQIRVLSIVLAALMALSLAPPAHAAVRPRIQGVVVDQGGRPVDDVTVVAERPDGTAAASMLSYASARADGPQHGYFFLAVGSAGLYTVTLSKPGYRRREVGSFDVISSGVVSLGPVVLRKRLVPTATTLRLDDRTLTTRQRTGVRLRVLTNATTRPTGRVAIRVGRRTVRTVDLVRRDRGRAHVRVPGFTRGTHAVRATFTPDSPYLRASTSGRVVVKVRAARQRTARAWDPAAPLSRLLP